MWKWLGRTTRVAAGLALLGAVSLGAQAQTYSTPEDLVTGTDGVEKVRVAAEGDRALVVFERRDDSGDFWDVFFALSTDRGETWSAPINLTNTVGTGEPLTDNVRPRVAHANGRWIIVYSDRIKDGREGDIEAFYSDNVETADTVNDITWNGPIQVHSDGGAGDEDADPDLATDGAGNWLAVWDKVYDFSPVANNASDVWGAYSSDNGATWSSSFKVTTMPGDVSDTTATEDGDPGVAFGGGNWIVSFKSGDAGSGPQADEDVFITYTSNPTGAWMTPVNIHPWGATDAGDDDNPSIIYSSADDAFLVAWNSEENFAGAGTDADIMVAYCADTDPSTWVVLGAANDATTDVGPDESPGMASDAFGNIVASWSSDEDEAGNWDVDFAMSEDMGMTWSTPAFVEEGPGDDDATESTTEASAAGTFYTVYQGDDSAAATVAVLDLADTIGGGGGTITSSPAGLIQEGDYVTLTAPAGGTGYQWFRNGGPMTNGPRISGVDTQTLIFDTIVEADSATYTVRYDDGTKAEVESAPLVLDVLPAGSLPATGVMALAVVAGLLLSASLFLIGTRKLA